MPDKDKTLQQLDSTSKRLDLLMQRRSVGSIDNAFNSAKEKSTNKVKNDLIDRSNTYEALNSPSTTRVSGGLSNKDYEVLERSNVFNAYYDGFNSLDDYNKYKYKEKYGDFLDSAKDDDERDQMFRNILFREQYENSENPEDQEIWNNRDKLTLDDRDNLFSRKAFEATDTTPDINDKADSFLDAQANKDFAFYKTAINNLKEGEKLSLVKDFNDMSRELSQYYKQYIGTEKLDLSPQEYVDIIAKFNGWRDTGGDAYASQKLRNLYQDLVASKQSPWEKATNANIQFIDDAASFLIRFAGMTLAASGIGTAPLMKLNEQNGYASDYFNTILDNPITRYADKLSETHSWFHQDEFSELGMSAYPILNTSQQEKQVLSANTPFEVFGQYGFTVASTVASFGTSALAELPVKGAGILAKSLAGVEALNKSTKGISIAKNLIKAKKIANIVAAGSVGTIEGAQNAVQTKNDFIENGNADIEKRINKYAVDKIQNIINSGDSDKISTLYVDLAKELSKGDRDTYEQLMNLPVEGKVQLLLNELPSNDNFLKTVVAEHSQELADLGREVEEEAIRAMHIDFAGQSVINGMIGVTLKSTLQAPSVQRALRKAGFNKTAFDRRGVRIKGTGLDATAEAIKYTRWRGVYDRLKESLGEGIEEYVQDLSGAFATGYSNNKVMQYLNYKYGTTLGNEAITEDLGNSFVAGLNDLMDVAFDKSSIKDFVYGGLSTGIGGFNLNTNNVDRSKERLKGENWASYVARKSPIAWRSAFSPLFNNSERVEINRKREETAKRINDFFADKEVQKLFFNLSESASWDSAVTNALNSGDEKALRDTRFGKAVAGAYILNSLKGSEFYDALIESLRANSEFDINNLTNPDSEEARAARQFIQSPDNRGENISETEAIETIKNNANNILEILESVNKYSSEVEKLFGSDIDFDVKEGLVFQELAAENVTKRSKTLDDELSAVTSEIDKQESDIESSNLSANSQKVIAKYGSLSEAKKALANLNKDIDELNKQIANNNVEVKNQRRSMRGKSSATRKQNGMNIMVAKMTNRFLKSKLEDSKAAREELSREIKSYENDVPETNVDVEVEGKKESKKVRVDKVLTAKEIMSLDAKSRGHIIKEYLKYKEAKDNGETAKRSFSDAQSYEIEKVLNAGNKIYNDFNNKIIDRARLEYDNEDIIKQKLRFINNSQEFAMYAATERDNKKKELLDNQNQYIAEYDGNKTYSEFATEMSTIMDSDDEDKKSSVKRVLERAKSPYYERYKQSNARAKSLYESLRRNKTFDKLSENDKNLMSYVIDYLTDKDIDYEDNNAIVAALTEVNPETGLTRFNEYVYNGNLNSNGKDNTTFTNTEEIIQTFKNVIADTYREAREVASNAAQVEVTPTSSANNTPTPPQNPEIKNEPKEKEEPKPNPIVEAFRTNSNDAVAESAEKALKVIENTPEHAGKKEAIIVANNAVESLQDNFYTNTEEFLDALRKKANELDGTGDEVNKSAASILRRAISSVELSKSKPKGALDGGIKELSGRSKARLNSLESVTRYTRSTISVDSNIIRALDIQYLKAKFPDGVLTKFIDKYQIERFLQSLDSIRDYEISFIMSSQFTQDVKDSLNKSGRPYTEADIPVIPAIELPKNNGYAIVINDNGTERYFQPVGVLPYTGNINYGGSNRLGKIRDLAKNNDGDFIVKDTEGREVKTKPISIRASYKYTTNPDGTSVSGVAISDSVGAIVGTNRETRRSTSIYKNIRKNFLSRLGIKEENGDKRLVYNANNLKGDNSATSIELRENPVHKTMDKNSDSLIIDLFKNNEIDRALKSNSRIKRFAETLYDFFKKDFKTDGLFVRDAGGNLQLTASGQVTLNSLSEALGDKLSNFFNLPSRMSGNPFVYQISPSQIMGSEGITYTKIASDGKTPVFKLSVSDGTTTIDLGEVIAGENSTETQFNIIKNLFLDENNNPRLRQDNKDSFVKWQVPYGDVRRMGTDKNAMSNIQDIFDDDILVSDKSTFKYTVGYVEFNSPFNSEGSPIYAQPTVANADNATQNPINSNGSDTTTNTNGVVDTDSGATIETSDTKKPDSKKAKSMQETAVEKKVEAITGNSKYIRLTDDGKYYEDTRTGKKYARVTSIISTDDEIEAFDKESPWGLPSSHIGTTIDTIFRDFFDGKINSAEDIKKYPNINQANAKVNLIFDQLNKFKTELELKGLKVIPKDVTVTGTLLVNDSKGNSHTLDVAGTLDLLAYDSDGNFYIFDMKSHRGDISHKMPKYSRQLTLYKELLQKQYGVNVKSMQIISISTGKYSVPRGVKGGTAKYTLKEGTEHQLLSNGNEFRQVTPTLDGLIDVEHDVPTNININKLSEEDKKMLDTVQKMLDNQDQTVDQTSTSDEITKQPDAGKVEEVQVPKSDAEHIDPMSNLDIGGDDDAFDGFDMSEYDEGKLSDSSYEKPEYRWENVKDKLQSNGITKEKWDSYSDAEKDQTLKCIG